MTTNAMLPVSSSARPRARKIGALAAGAVRPIALALALVSGALGVQPAQAGPQCGEREQILRLLEQKHAETPQALGLSSDGGVLEILVSPEGGWTILVTYPRRPTCVVAAGQAWQSFARFVGQPA